MKYDPAPVPFFITRNLLWQHSLSLRIMRVDAFWNEDFLPSFIKNITKSVSLHEVIHEFFYIMADHHFLRMYCASSDQMINISVSDRVYEVTCYIAVLVSFVFLFSLFFWLQTNSHGETVKTLYFSYLAVLQKVANHVALLQSTGTSKHQV